MNWIVREVQRADSAYNAGSKARADVDAVVTSAGFQPLIANLELDLSQGFFKKIILQFQRFFQWKKSIRQVQEGDTVVVQFPVRNHTVFFQAVLSALEKKGVKTIGVIHDLEALRLSISESIPFSSRIRYQLEEVQSLKHFSGVVVHNEKMRQAVRSLFDLPEEKLVSLEIFDYLYDGALDRSGAAPTDPVIIAGNLDKRKCGYIYQLPKDVPFHLYGANYDESYQAGENVSYLGKVKPDALPGVLKGSFGLVWDGPSAKACEGVYGKYLKVNNPHKVSLYLASGIPVIVWKESAMADFVLAHDCGVAVDSLETLGAALRAVTAADYARISRNADAVGAQLRNGDYTRAALSACLQRGL